MTLSADIKYKSNWQQGAIKGAYTLMHISSGGFMLINACQNSPTKK